MPPSVPGEADDDETALIVDETTLSLSALDDHELLVLDTGCTVHTKRNMRGGFNIRPVKQKNVVTFDGRAMPIKHKFDMRVKQGRLRLDLPLAT